MKTAREKIALDATGKRIGRLASAIANTLNGKDTPMYAPNQVPNVTVEVANASRMRIDEKKKKKVYERYTGFFHGRRETTLAEVADKKGYGEILRKAVYGMLPGNRLRNEKMKRLHINE